MRGHHIILFERVIKPSTDASRNQLNSMKGQRRPVHCGARPLAQWWTMKHLGLVLDPLVLAADHDRAEGSFAGCKSTDRAAREEILNRAYAIWESEGHPANRELSNWLQAESGILGQR